MGPGSAAHRNSASKTRVNALLVVQCRPGIVSNSERETVPEQQCTAEPVLGPREARTRGPRLALHRDAVKLAQTA